MKYSIAVRVVDTFAPLACDLLCRTAEMKKYVYVFRRDRADGSATMRELLGGLIAAESLDAIVYPTSPVRPERVDPDPDPDAAPGSGGSAVILANLTGFPDLIVPAGFTGRGLPVGISFYTFQSMSYTIDVYRGTLAAERSAEDRDQCAYLVRSSICSCIKSVSSRSSSDDSMLCPNRYAAVEKTLLIPGLTSAS